MVKNFKYILDIKSDLCTQEERKAAYNSFLSDLEAGEIDPALSLYLLRFFQSNILVPCFSCEGHGDRGYIIFRSFYSIDYTLNVIFKPLLLVFSMNVDLDLCINFFPKGGINYIIYFSSKDLDQVLISLLEVVENHSRS